MRCEKSEMDFPGQILEKSDYTMISGNTYIKKTCWRKISFYFNLSFEIKDKTIEFDENRNVQRAEFIVRAYMQGGRFSDGWGSDGWGSDGRRSSQNQIMIFLAQQKLEPKIGHARCVI